MDVSGSSFLSNSFAGELWGKKKLMIVFSADDK
jgi:hypothetical protein